jgi:2,4-dienoyl-CoA reductase-like NADH-dependent reductase (Old Yellow Enzyme family)/thioredoxin reductase
VSEFPTLLSPITVGTMPLRNRVMMPPHTAPLGPLWGTDEQAAQNIAYIRRRCEAGVAWIVNITGHIDNLFVPGFTPVGIGARTSGYFRLPHFHDRVQAYTEAIHAAGSFTTVQLVSQGGLPNAPSATLSSPVLNAVPHVLDRDEIQWYVQEFGWSAHAAQRAGADGIDLHLNHDDLMEWFVSPLVNSRDDEYGGSLDNRLRFVREILRDIRERCGSDFTVGVRLNMFEEAPGGYDLEEGIEIARRLEATGMVDYLSLVAGSNWGNPSYIQTHVYPPAAWAELSGEFVKAVDLPIAYAGRVTTPEVAEQVLAAGQAHVVGVARALLADPDWVAKAAAGRSGEIRPCTGCDDCISSVIVERTAFACAVNPHAGTESTVDWPVPATTSRDVLVVGGGPAGLEVAALAAERGHRVRLWEASDRLGGLLRTASAAPTFDGFGMFLDWQERRVRSLGVDVRLRMRVEVDDVLAEAPDIVVVATGTAPRRPGVPGDDLPFVHDVRHVLDGSAPVTGRVVVVAQDDHVAPLAVADHLAGLGHDVTIVYATLGPAPLLSRYAIGGFLARLETLGVRIRTSEQVARIDPGEVSTRRVYSQRPGDPIPADTVVLACGGVPQGDLAVRLRGRVPAVHVVGDAFAPRRQIYATREAYALVAGME